MTKSNSKLVGKLTDLRFLTKIGMLVLVVLFFFPWIGMNGFPYHSDWRIDTLSGLGLVNTAGRIVSGSFIIFIPLAPLLILVILTVIEEEFRILRNLSFAGFVLNIAYAGWLAFRSHLNGMAFTEWIGYLRPAYYAIIVVYALMFVITYKGKKMDDIY